MFPLEILHSDGRTAGFRRSLRWPAYRVQWAWIGAIILFGAYLASAGESVLSWRAATKLHFESEFVRGDEHWVALPPKAASLRQTGTFDVVSGSRFVLRETEGGATWKYTGTYVPRQHGKTMLLKLDKTGRSALAKKIERMVKAKPLDGRVTIQSVAVELNKVSQPLLERPKAGEKQKVSFAGTGTYRVLWRFYWVWPLPAAYGYSTWHFTFRESLVVGPGP